MHPILFEFGPLKIYSYGLLVALAFMLSISLARLEAARQKINPDKILHLGMCILLSSILGARLLYIFQNLNFYLKYPLQMLMVHKGGLSFYGGFILATICAGIFLKRQHLPIGQTFDLASPYVALAQAIGRIGCFLNGCCFGQPTIFFLGVNFPGEDLMRHPVQIYASLNLLFIFIVLRILQAKMPVAKPRISGQIFLLYCLLYSSSRFFLEYLRADNLPLFANLTVHQLISLVIFAVAAGVWWWRWRKSRCKFQVKIKV